MNNNGSNGVVREELALELSHLREVVRDVGESFILRREGEIETILSHLAAVPSGVLRNEAHGWLHELHRLRLKPAKGRLKDLKGIDALIKELAEQVMGAQYRRKCKVGKPRKAGASRGCDTVPDRVPASSLSMST